MMSKSLFFLCVAFVATASGAAVNSSNNSDTNNSARRTFSTGISQWNLQTNEVHVRKTVLIKKINETEQDFTANFTKLVEQLRKVGHSEQKAIRESSDRLISNLEKIVIEELKKAGPIPNNHQTKDCIQHMDNFTKYHKTLKSEAKDCIKTVTMEAFKYLISANIDYNEGNTYIQSLKSKVSKCEDEGRVYEIIQKLRDISDISKKIETTFDNHHKFMAKLANEFDKECLHSETVLTDFRNSLIATINLTKKCIKDILSSDTQSLTARVGSE